MADYSQVIEGLNRLIRGERRLRTAAVTTHNLMSERIFVEGKNADGSNIGIYDKSPIYVNPNRSPKKFATGGKKSSLAKAQKTGRAKTLARRGGTSLAVAKKLLRKHKTKYFQSGYYEFRAAAGRQNSYVDLRLTGTLRGSFVLAPSEGGFVSKFLNEKQALIAQGNEDRFNATIFELTQTEIDTFVNIIAETDVD